MTKSLFTRPLVFTLLVFISIAPSQSIAQVTLLPTTINKAPAPPVHKAPGTAVQPANTIQPLSQPQIIHVPDFFIGNVVYYLPEKEIRFEVHNRGGSYQGDLSVLVQRVGAPSLEKYLNQTVNMRKHGRVEMAVSFTIPNINFLCSLDIEITVDPFHRVRELNENNNIYNGHIYRDVRAVFLLLPHELNLILQRKRFSKACNTSPSPFIITKNHMGMDYNHVNGTARIKAGIPLKNCGHNYGTDSMSFDVFHTTPGENTTKLIERPDFVRNVRIGSGENRLFEQTFTVPVQPGTYRVAIRKDADIHCTIEWQFHEEFF